LTELVKRDQYDLDDMIPKVVDAESVLDGNTWLIPQRADVQVLFYNRGVFDNQALQLEFRRRTGKDLGVPETWDDYLVTARGLKDLTLDGKRIVGCAETLKRPHFAFEFFATRYWSITGADFLNGKDPIFAGPDGVKALEYMKSLHDVWAPGSINADHDATVGAFSNGSVAMIPQWFAFYAVLKREQGGLGGRLGVALMPGARTSTNEIRRSPSIGGGSLGIAANSTAPDPAWQFIKYMTSRKIMAEAALAGEIITRKSAYADPQVKQRNPAIEIYLKSLDLSKFRPRSVAYAAIESAIGEGVSRALAGEASPSQALADASKAVVDIHRNAG
jgi:multiple sugar transport system substrate-binding protein